MSIERRYAEAGMRAWSGDEEEAAAGAADVDSLQLEFQMITPVKNPMKVYHRKHCVFKVDKDGNETFIRAHGTAVNLARLLDEYGVRVRWNELAREAEVWIGEFKQTGELVRNTNLSKLEDVAKINAYPYTQVATHISALAADDAYNPAVDWIREKAWDKTPRIDDLFACLTLVDESKRDLSRALFRKWLRGAVAVLTGNAPKFEHILVLVDQRGGIGKTRFFETLTKPEFMASGVTLDPSDKDSVLQVVSKWLVELGEIGATFSKSDIEELKAFLSRSHDEIRPPYERAANRYPRRTAFFGSVNNARFLIDDTSNRRFWPIEVSAVAYQHNIDMQQVWAEALSEVEVGASWWLDEAENRAIGEHNEAFRSMDAVEERILANYDPALRGTRYMSASDVLDEIGMTHARQADTRRASSVLRKLFKHKVSKGYTVYHLPEPGRRASHLTVVPDCVDGPF